VSAPVANGICLSVTQLDACWELLGLGDAPCTLSLPSPGRTWSERRQVLAGVLEQLGQLGLADGAVPGEKLASPLRLLAGPDYQVDLRFGGDLVDTAVAIGAVAGSEGVVLVRSGEDVVVRRMRSARMLPTLLGLLPPLRAGVGRSVNIPADMYDDARGATVDGNLWTMADHLVAGGLPRLDAGSWVRMCTGIRSFGQLGTTFRPGGDIRFGPWVIGFHGTDSGYYLQLRRPAPGGATVTMCPLEQARLYQLTEELLADGY
jgi:hypothetical protein